jgi:hypothetical protein
MPAVMFRRRETMIALRARHQAFRIANEVGHLPLESPPRPPQPAIPIVEWRDPPRWRAPVFMYLPPDPPKTKLGRFLMSDIVLSLLAILSGLAVILLCKYG